MAFNRRDVIGKLYVPVATDGSYTTGQVVGVVTKISEVVEDGGAAAMLQTLVVTDAANQKGAIDLIFFNAAPVNSVGADGASYGLDDSDLTKIIGRFSVATADFVSSGSNNAEATLRNIGLLLKAAPKFKDIWILMVARGTINLGAASDLSVLLVMEKY